MHQWRFNLFLVASDHDMRNGDWWQTQWPTSRHTSVHLSWRLPNRALLRRYRLTINGLLPHPIKLTLAQLKSLGKEVVVASLMVRSFSAAILWQ